MKLIEEVSIWDNGKTKKASILNAYAINLVLNESATFYYALYSQTEDGLQDMLASGNLSMTGDDYKNWTSDDGVWQFIADSLNLVIVGDYVAPVAEQPIAESLIVEPVVQEVIEEPIIESAIEPIAIVEEAPVTEETVAEELKVEEPIVENNESI